MEYRQLRKDILHYLKILQDNGFSYQSICDFMNGQQTDFVLYKDFFSRFQSKLNYYNSLGKQKKLSAIHQQMRDFFQQEISEDYFIHEHLEKTIHNAAMVRFEFYLATNRPSNLSHSRLAEFYFENSPAYLSIENSLKQKDQYNWELDLLQYGSTFDVLSCQISRLFHKHAVVTTEEFWKLTWVDKTFKKLQFNFNALTQHTYLLSKDQAGNWRIIEDMAQTKTLKIEPEFIDYPALVKLSSSNWRENKAIAKNYLVEEDLLYCIAFIHTAYSGRLPLNQSAILDRIRESCLNSYRLFNTDKINYAAFKSELASLKKQLDLMIDSIFLEKRS